MRSVNHSGQILSTMVRGSRGDLLHKWTWGFPIQLLGILVGHVYHVMGDIDEIDHREGATLIQSKRPNWGAFTVGSLIISHGGTRVDSGLFMHEYGHYLQSKVLGPFYLLIIIIPSLYSAAFRKTHDDFFTETWANRLSEKHFR